MNKWLGISRITTGGDIRREEGYTITEMLIVLGVTAMMFAAVLVAFSGRQSRVEFTQAVRDYEAYLQGVMSDVANGYYTSEGFSCSSLSPNYVPSINTSPDGETGTSGQCIFVGKLLRPGYKHVATPDGSYNTVYPIIGSRLVSESASYRGVMKDYDHTTIALGIGDVSNNTFQLMTEKVVVPADVGGAFTDVEYIAFINNRSIEAGVDNSVVAYSFSASGLSSGLSFDSDGHISSFDPELDSGKTKPVIFCLKGKNDQRAEIEIGAGGSSLFSTLDTGMTSRCP